MSRERRRSSTTQERLSIRVFVLLFANHRSQRPREPLGGMSQPDILADIAGVKPEVPTLEFSFVVVVVVVVVVEVVVVVVTG